PDGIGHRGPIDDRAVDDAVGRNRFAGEGSDLVGFADGLQFDGFDGARSDVEADDSFWFAQSEHERTPSAKRIPIAPPRRSRQKRGVRAETANAGATSCLRVITKSSRDHESAMRSRRVRSASDVSARP